MNIFERATTDATTQIPTIADGMNGCYMVVGAVLAVIVLFSLWESSKGGCR